MSNFLEKAKRGIPIDDALIIDCHDHIGYWAAFHLSNHSAEGMLSSMDALGIDKACITAHASIGPNYKYGNDIVIDAVTKYPDRFIGYVTVNPNYPDDMKNELERCFAIEGMKAIKLHPSCHGSTIDNKNYHVAYETANERQCPVLIHVWGKADVDAVDRMSSLYPKAQFIMGHGGGDIKAMEHALKVVNKHDNVYVDLCLSIAVEGNVEWFVKEIGSNKVLFGTDLPFLDPRPTFARLAMAEISDEEKKNIFGLNMARLLKLY